MRIGIKLGSKTLTDGKGEIRHETIIAVCRQASFLIRQGHDVFLVSSGALASDPHLTRSSNLRSTIGQPFLMALYVSYLKILGIECGQLLVTDYNFKHPRILIRTLQEAFDQKVLMIFNANDGVDDRELKALEKCADNDSLLQMICLLPELKIDSAIIGIDEPGLLDKQGNLISVITQGNYEEAFKCAGSGNELGHKSKKGDKDSGMKKKLKVCAQLSHLGLNVILAPASQENFILRSLARFNGNGNNHDFGTIFKLK